MKAKLSEKKRPGWGGVRPGSGRPKGTLRGIKAKAYCISMTPDLMEKLDKIRGNQTRSGWIADRIKEH